VGRRGRQRRGKFSRPVPARLGSVSVNRSHPAQGAADGAGASNRRRRGVRRVGTNVDRSRRPISAHRRAGRRRKRRARVVESGSGLGARQRSVGTAAEHAVAARYDPVDASVATARHDRFGSVGTAEATRIEADFTGVGAEFWLVDLEIHHHHGSRLAAVDSSGCR